MRAGWVVPVVLCCAVFTVTACGSGGGSDKASAADRQAAAAHKAKRKRLAVYRTCQQTFTDLTKKLKALDSRLDIGLSYDEYTNAVGDVKVAYDQSGFDSLSGAGQTGCLTTVGLPLEQALNQHSKAANVWSKCFDDVDCDTDSIKPELQEHWTKASGLVDDSETEMTALKR